jgi:hypothetical protein
MHLGHRSTIPSDLHNNVKIYVLLLGDAGFETQ